MIPFEISKPAALRGEPADDALLPTYCVGCQPSSAIFLMLCGANLGVVMLMKTWAPADLHRTTWLSMVGSAVSYESSATMADDFSPSPSLKPFRTSRPKS